MDTSFEAIFFLGVGLLGITITVFVLAVSLLGRAIKLSIQEQKETEERAKKDIDDKIKEIRSKLDETASSAHPDFEKLQKNLAELIIKQHQHQAKLNSIKNKPSFLRVGGGVLLPGIFFVISIVFCIFSRYYFGQNPNTNMLGYYFGAIVPMIIGMNYIYQTLKVIESVAITSDETSLTRETEAVKKALIEVEEAKKPELTLTFIGFQPPFKVKPNSEIEISCDINITRGQLAKNIVVCFWASQGFIFITESDPVVTRNPKYINYVCFKTTLPDIIGPGGVNFLITLKTPSKIGKYIGVYRIYCEGFYSDFNEFEIIVE